MAKCKLSVAIRKGCEVSGPRTGSFIGTDASGRLTACVLGAALIGEFGFEESLKQMMIHEVEEIWPELANAVRVGKYGRVTTLGEHLVSLNDQEGVPREQLANMVEELGL